MRRFREDPTSLPGTFVIKLYLDGQKAITAHEVPQAEDDVRLSVLDRVKALPPAHATGLIQTEIGRLQAELADLHAALKDLTGD